MDAAKELVKVGLTEFDDYIRAGKATAARRAPKVRRPAPDPEMEQARHELAQYARELTEDGRTVIRLYSEVMDGLRNDEGFKPHHRIAAGRELLRRGFDYDQATPDSDVMPANAGIQTPEPTTNDSELTTNDSETDEPTDYLAIVKRVVESLGPIEEEEEDESGHTPDYSMWDMIEYPPTVGDKRRTRRDRRRPLPRSNRTRQALEEGQRHNHNEERPRQLPTMARRPRQFTYVNRAPSR